MRPLLSFSFLCYVLFSSCNNPVVTVQNKQLTQKERFYCDSLHIDTSIITGLRLYLSAPVEPFHYSLSTQMRKDSDDIELDPVHLQGFVIKSPNDQSTNIVLKLRDQFWDKGYSIFLLDNNFNIRNKPDVIGILKTTDKYEILKEIGTNGANYNIDPDSVVNIIKVFDRKYSLDLVGASGDWCEFIIKKEPADWLQMAKEAYKVCPDIVDQGAGTVAALAQEMKRTRHLYFWWD